MSITLDFKLNLGMGFFSERRKYVVKNDFILRQSFAKYLK